MPSDSPYKKGSIYRIAMENFLTYEGPVEFNPGPRLNVVLGPNGTGKSSIVCAICVGLNGNLSILGRAEKIQDFIRHGAESAWVEIELYNPGGENMIIRREIEKIYVSEKVSNKFKINGRVTTGAEVKKKIKEMNVQIDNLCQFLPQDKVQEFSTMKDREKLRETVRAVMGQATLDQHDELIGLQKQGNQHEEKCKSARDELAHLQQNHDTLKAVVDSQRGRQEHLDQVNLHKGKLMWVQTEAKRDECVALKEEKKHTKAAVKEAREQLAPKEAAMSNTENSERDLKDVQRAALGVWKQKGRAKSKHIDKIDQQIEARKSIDYELRQLHQSRDKAQKELEAEEKLLEALRQQLREQPPADKLDAQISELSKTLKSESREVQKIQHELDDLAEQVRPTQRQIKAVQQKISKEKNVEQQKLRQLHDKDKDAYRALLWLNEHRGRFRRKVWGPIMTELEVANKEHQVCVENAIPYTTMIAFVTECQEDYNLFISEVSERQKIRITVYNSQGVGATVKPFSNQRHAANVFSRPIAEDVLGKMNRFGILGYVDQVIQCGDPVKRALFAQNSIHKQLIGNANTEKALTNSSSPLSKMLANSKLFPSGYRLFTSTQIYHAVVSQYGNRQMSVSTGFMQRKGYLGEQANPEKMEQLQDEERELQQQLSEVKHQADSKKVDARKLQKQVADLTRQRKELRDTKNEGTRMQKKEVRLEGNIVRLRNDCEQDVDAEERQMQKRRTVIVKKYVKLIKDLQNKTNEVFDSNTTAAIAALNHSAANELLRRIRRDVESFTRRVNEAEQAHTQKSAEYDERKQETLALKAQAEASYPMTDELAEKFKQLPDELQELEDKISEYQDLANAVVANPEAFAKFERVKEQIEAKQIELDSLTGDKEEQERKLID